MINFGAQRQKGDLLSRPFLEFGCTREEFVVSHEAQERLPISVCRVHYREREVVFSKSRV